MVGVGCGRAVVDTFSPWHYLNSALQSGLAAETYVFQPVGIETTGVYVKSIAQF